MQVPFSEVRGAKIPSSWSYRCELPDVGAGKELGSYRTAAMCTLNNSSNVCAKLQIPSSGAGCPIAETGLEFLNHLPLPPKCWIIGTSHNARLESLFSYKIKRDENHPVESEHTWSMNAKMLIQSNI